MVYNNQVCYSSLDLHSCGLFRRNTIADRPDAVSNMLQSRMNVLFKKSLICVLMALIFLLIYFRDETGIFSPGQATASGTGKSTFGDRILALFNGRNQAKISSAKDTVKKIVVGRGTDKFTFEYKVLAQLDRQNQAKMSTSTDPGTRDVLKKADSRLFHIVTTFVPFDNAHLRKNLQLSYPGPVTDQLLEARMAEVIDCLQRNLNHKIVAFVHVLVFRDETINYLRYLNLENSQKLIIHRNKESPKMLHEILYASQYLQGKMVAVTHQDNYIGTGWEQIDPKVLQKGHLMYALTRHPSPSKCSAAMSTAHCGGDYLGNHDTFVFYANEPLPRDQLNEIDVTPNMAGIENIIIWIFQTKLKYRVLNPCKRLIVYHSHCVPIRERGRVRINSAGNTGLAKYTDKLQ